MEEEDASLNKRSSDRGALAAWWGRIGSNVVPIIAVGIAAVSVGVAQRATSSANGATESANSAVAESLRASERALHAAGQAQAAVSRIRSETRERIDETCRIQETKQRSDIESLRRTYEYLASLSSAELTQPLNRTILAGLPRTIREATIDDAPDYCDEPGVGLPEPDLRLPERPKNIPPSG